MARLTMQEFRTRFDEEVRKRRITWEVKGFYTADGRILPFGTDTKVLSTVFESLCAPVILDIAQEYGYEVSFAPQTVYPDFTLTAPGTTSNRIAIDVKTTYREGENGVFRFTLGSYTSFLRDGKKNILFPYSEYSEHWIIGFVYQRREDVASKVYGLAENPSEIVCPYYDVQYFIQEKHRIAGTSPGSGNTTNIGSFPTTSLKDLAEGIGPFAKSGKVAFEEFWRNYSKPAKRKPKT